MNNNRLFFYPHTKNQ